MTGFYCQTCVSPTTAERRAQGKDFDRAKVDVEETRSPAQQSFLLEPDELARKCGADEHLVTVDGDLSIPEDAPYLPFGRVARDNGRQLAALRVAIDLRWRLAAERVVGADLVELDHPSIAGTLLGPSGSRGITFELA